MIFTRKIPVLIGRLGDMCALWEFFGDKAELKCIHIHHYYYYYYYLVFIVINSIINIYYYYYYYYYYLFYIAAH